MDFCRFLSALIFCIMIKAPVTLAMWANAPPTSVLVSLITPYEHKEGSEDKHRTRVHVLLVNGTSCTSGRMKYSHIDSNQDPSSRTINSVLDDSTVEKVDSSVSDHSLKQVVQSTHQITPESDASKLERKDIKVITESLTEKSGVNKGEDKTADLNEMTERSHKLANNDSKSNSSNGNHEGFTDQILIPKPLYFVEAVRIVNGILLCGVENVSVVYPVVRMRQKLECYTWHKGTTVFQKVAQESAIDLQYVGFSPTPYVLFIPRPLILVSTIRDENRIGNPSSIVDNNFAFPEDHIYALVRTDDYVEEPEDMFIIGKFEKQENHGSLRWRRKPDVIQPPDIAQLKGNFICGVMFKLQLHLFDIQHERYWRYHAISKQWSQNDPLINWKLEKGKSIGKRMFAACGIYHNNLIYGGGIKSEGYIITSKTNEVQILREPYNTTTYNNLTRNQFEQCDIDLIREKIINGTRLNPESRTKANGPELCKVLDPQSHVKFDHSVHGYSFFHNKWDPIYDITPMNNDRMLHRFATLSDGRREYLMAVFGRTKWYQRKNTVEIFIHDYHNYWINEKIKGLPSKPFNERDDLPWKLTNRFTEPTSKSLNKPNWTETGNFDFATVVIPAEWLPTCNHKLEWNNHEMLSHGINFKELKSQMAILIVLLIYLVNLNSLKCFH